MSLLLLALALPAPAAAQGRKVREAQSFVDRGDQLFDHKRYEQAIAEYTRALAIVPHADLVWNIARAHEELSQHKQALAFFEQYAGMKVGVEDKTAADAKIAAMKAALTAARTGRLVVTTGSAGAVVLVGGVEVGRGATVRAVLKPGRYRVKVELAGHVPFESVVRIQPAGEETIAATLKRAEPRAVLVVETGVPGTTVSVSGGREEAAGAPIPLDGGVYKIRVRAPRRAPLEKLIEAPAGKKTVVRVELGPERAATLYPLWTAEYRVFGLDRSPEVEAVRRGSLQLTEADSAITGTLRAVRRLALEKWRRDACRGAEAAEWTSVWDARAVVRERGARLLLTGGRHEGCTCDTWCKVLDSLKLPLIPLPGREGFVSDSVVVLRTALAEDAATHPWRKGTLDLLAGEWDLLRFDGVIGDATDSLVIQGDAGTLTQRRTGLVPSYKRTSCPGKRRFEQQASWTVRLRPGHRVVLVPGSGREVSCSCPGACGAVPALAETTVRMVSFGRYLVGPGTLLRRRADSEGK